MSSIVHACAASAAARIRPQLAAGIHSFALDAMQGWTYYAGGPLPECISDVMLDPTEHAFVSILAGADLSRLIGSR